MKWVGMMFWWDYSGLSFVKRKFGQILVRHMRIIVLPAATMWNQWVTEDEKLKSIWLTAPQRRNQLSTQEFQYFKSYTLTSTVQKVSRDILTILSNSSIAHQLPTSRKSEWLRKRKHERNEGKPVRLQPSPKNPSLLRKRTIRTSHIRSVFPTSSKPRTIIIRTPA
jgi:hypothetical protein